MRVDNIVTFALIVWHELLREFDNKVARVRLKSFMATSREDKTRLFRETRQDRDVEVLGIDHTLLGFAEHLFARNIDQLDGAVVELVQLALKDDFDILGSVLGIDPIELLLMLACRYSLNVRVGGAKELLEDFEVLALVDITREAIGTLHDTMLETIFAILVVDAFH